MRAENYKPIPKSESANEATSLVIDTKNEMLMTLSDYGSNEYVRFSASMKGYTKYFTRDAKAVLDTSSPNFGKVSLCNYCITGVTSSGVSKDPKALADRIMSKYKDKDQFVDLAMGLYMRTVLDRFKTLGLSGSYRSLGEDEMFTIYGLMENGLPVHVKCRAWGIERLVANIFIVYFDADYIRREIYKGSTMEDLDGKVYSLTDDIIRHYNNPLETSYSYDKTRS